MLAVWGKKRCNSQGFVTQDPRWAAKEEMCDLTTGLEWDLKASPIITSGDHREAREDSGAHLKENQTPKLHLDDSEQYKNGKKLSSRQSTSGDEYRKQAKRRRQRQGKPPTWGHHY